MASAKLETASSLTGRTEWSGYALGFGLGGFFDGILLHQVLQWHHLLSGVEQARHDIRVLILTDGLFHLLMYVVAGIGLWLLWRARGELSASGAGRRLVGSALVGFGIWHIVDSVLSDWILGIHRIRMDTENPLFWDLLWFAVFGVVPLLLGWMLHRRARVGQGRARATNSPLALVLAVAIAGPWAALPAPNDGTVMVLFRPDITPPQAFAAMRSVEGRVLWTDATEQLWAIDISTGGNPANLYGQGAMLVSNSILPAGCFDWLQA